MFPLHYCWLIKVLVWSGARFLCPVLTAENVVVREERRSKWCDYYMFATIYELESTEPPAVPPAVCHLHIQLFLYNLLTTGILEISQECCRVRNFKDWGCMCEICGSWPVGCGWVNPSGSCYRGPLTFAHPQIYIMLMNPNRGDMHLRGPLKLL